MIFFSKEIFILLLCLQVYDVFIELLPLPVDHLFCILIFQVLSVDDCAGVVDSCLIL